MKRCLDLTLVLLTAPLWMVVLMLTAVVVFGAMGRPILFVQERAGYKGKPFSLYKFRTMRLGDSPDAERLTAFGRFLRASSLDELPELVNVLVGDMSLVGPRPLPIRYLERYSSEQMHRHDVLPGITGLAQVNGRNALDWESKFRYDLRYVATHSLALDLKILCMTAVQVVFPRAISHEGEATMSEFTGNPATHGPSLV